MRALDAADDVGRDRRARVGLGLDALDLAVQRDHRAALADAAEAHERHREDAPVERGVRAGHVEQQLAAGEVGRLAAGQPAGDVQEVRAAVRRQRERDAVGVTGGAGTPDDAAAAKIDLVAADAEKGRQGRSPAPRRRLRVALRGDGLDGLDAAEQRERAADVLAVELPEARAHEPRVGAVAEASPRPGSAGCRCGSRRRAATG